MRCCAIAADCAVRNISIPLVHVHSTHSLISFLRGWIEPFSTTLKQQSQRYTADNETPRGRRASEGIKSRARPYNSAFIAIMSKDACGAASYASHGQFRVMPFIAKHVHLKTFSKSHLNHRLSDSSSPIFFARYTNIRHQASFVAG